jgi:hypothetical protein
MTATGYVNIWWTIDPSMRCTPKDTMYDIELAIYDRHNTFHTSGTYM